MFKRYSFIVLSFFLAFTINAQQDPLAVEFSGSGNPMPGSTYDVDVRVSDFDQLFGAQLFVGWDSLVLEIDSITFITADLAEFNSSVFGLPSQTASMTKGQISISWFAPTPQTLPDDHLLFTMRFNVVGSDCDSTQVGIVEFPPNLLTEVYDQNLENIGATFQGHDAVIPGTDCGGGGGTMIDDEVGLIFPDVFAAPGESICLPFTTINFDSVETFQGSLMWDPDILEYTGVQNFALPGMSVGSFNTNNTGSGIVSFVWFDATGVTPASLADNSTIFEICFDVIGSDGETSVVKAFDGATSIQISSPFPTGIRDHVVVEGSVTVGENMEGQEFSIKADTVEVDRNSGEVCVDFSTLNFNDIAGMQYTLQWDSTVLEYSRVIAVNTEFTSTFNLAATDRLRYSWTHSMGVGLDLPDGSIIYQVCFDLIGDCDESTALEFIGEPGRPIEITDGTFNPIPDNQVNMMNGLVTIVCGLNLDATINHVRCNDESNGSIVLNIIGGTAPYNVVWEDSTPTIIQEREVDASDLLVGRGADTYTVTVTDSFGDTATATYTIEEPDALEITVNVNGNDVDIQVSGGTMPYTQEVNPPLADPVEDGTYTVLITDDNGCQETAIFVVGAMCDDPVSLSTVAFSAICGDDGRIEVNCSGGSGNYDISSDPDLTFSNGEFINVPVGSYQITCTDSDNPACSETTTVQVLQGAPEDLELVVNNIQDAGCDGSDGAILLGVTGGCEPYDLQYSYEGGSNVSYDPNAGYPAGEYVFTLTDDAGTVVTETITVGTSSGDDLIATLDETVDAPCTGMDGSATISVSGGCGTISCAMMVNGGSNQGCDLEDNGDGTYFGDFSTGSYVITFTDDFMGATSSVSFTIETSDDALSASIANVGTNSIDIDVNGGVAPFQFFWMDPNGDAIPGNNEDLTDLTIFGTYSVTIVDDLGCSFALSVNLAAPGDPVLDIFPIDEPFDGFATPCAEGECMGVISGEIEDGAAPYMLVLTDENLNETEITINAEGLFDITDLCAGSYMIEGSDADGNEFFHPNPIIITSPAPIVIAEDELDCPDSGQNNGSISATVSGGTGLGYIYTWSPESGDPIPGPTNEDLGTGVYTLTVEDSNGCEASFSFDLLTDCIDTDCFIGKKVFTPNADGANDLFAISCASDRGFTLRVFDRWGVLVYSSTNYRNDWDGIADDGDTVPEGAYHWVLLTDAKTYTGVVTLLRD